MSDNPRQTRTAVVVVSVVLATLIGGIALTGAAAAAENLHDGSVTDPSTGETIYAANSSEKKSMTYGYVVENVTNSGESVKLYLEFDDTFNNSAGDNRLSSFGGNVTCVCGGNPEPVSIASSPSIVDGPDNDGVKETIEIGVQPNKKDTPIELIVNFTGDVTWTNESTNVVYPVRGAVVEPNQNVAPTQFEDVIVAGGLYTETAGASSVSDSGATVSAHLWNLNGSSSANISFTYWEQGNRTGTEQTTTPKSVDGAPATYSQTISGLNNSTTYVFKSTASTATETDDGPKLTFTTGSGTSSGGGGSDSDGSDAGDPDISNYQVTADGNDVTVSFDSDELLAEIEVDVRGAEDATLTTEDFDGNEIEGYTATYQASADGEYTLELVTAEDGSGNDGADDGDYTDSATVEDADDDSPTPTPTETDDVDITPSDENDATRTPTDEDADGDATLTPTEADDETASPIQGDEATDSTAVSPTDEDGAGFGGLVALAALLASALVFYRRR